MISAMARGGWAEVIALGKEIERDLGFIYNGNVEGRARAQMGFAYRQLGEDEKARRAFERGAEVWGGLGDLKSQGLMMVFVGRSQMAMGAAFSRDSSSSFDKARRLGLKLSDFALESESCRGLADLAKREGRLEEAQLLAQQAFIAVDLLREGDEKDILKSAALCSLLDCSDLKALDFDEALLHQFVEIAGEIHQPQAIGFLAARHIHMGRRAEALAACTAILALAAKVCFTLVTGPRRP